MSRPSREAVMTALFDALVDSCQTSFTADTEAGSVILSNPSTTSGLFVGLPVVGGTLPRGAVITQLSPLEVSLPAAVNALAVPLSTGFLTASRRFQFWSSVTDQPALFLQGKEEDLEYSEGNVQQTQIIRAQFWIYSNSGKDPDAVPETALNNLLDAVQSVFQPDSPTGQFTLGGLVSWCRMVGKVDKQPGDASGQAIAAADVEILVP